jgi:MoxR-like ATPase
MAVGYTKLFDPGDVVNFASKRHAGVGDRRDGLVYVYGGAEHIVLAVNVALATARPLLIRGPSGSGKSSLAYNVAKIMGYRYYEHVITARTAALDLLWRFDVVRRLADAQAEDLNADPSWYVEPGVLWRAFDPALARAQGARDQSPPAAIGGSRTGARPADYGPEMDEVRAVVLLDEIDKADPDLPNSLLVPLGSYEFTVTDTQPPLVVKVPEKMLPPLIFITSNDERELPPAFVRRCLALTLAAPDKNQLVEIAKAHFGRTGVKDYRRIADQIVQLGAAPGGGRRGLLGVSAAEFIDAVQASRELNVDPDPGNPDWVRIVETALQKPRDLLTLNE